MCVYIFHDVKNFHITENQSVDIMHDVFEGVACYVMRNQKKMKKSIYFLKRSILLVILKFSKILK